MLRRHLLKAAGLIPFISLPRVKAYEYKNDPNVIINYDETNFGYRKYFIAFKKKKEIVYGIASIEGDENEYRTIA